MSSGAHLAAQDDWKTLYREAFRLYGAAYLWNLRELPEPVPGHALAAARQLRSEGNMETRRFAERMERAVHAA